MGSFSFLRAEHTTKRANIARGDIYKILVPAEFGGGYIRDKYYGYGYVFDSDAHQAEDGSWKHWFDSEYVDAHKNRYPCSMFPTNDLYGILAWWNGLDGILVRYGEPQELIYEGDAVPRTMVDILKNGKTCSYGNRSLEIDIGCYDTQIERLKYPLKLVSASYKGSYEDCAGRSYGDISQGYNKLRWTDRDVRDELKKLKEAEQEIK